MLTFPTTLKTKDGNPQRKTPCRIISPPTGVNEVLPQRTHGTGMNLYLPTGTFCETKS